MSDEQYYKSLADQYLAQNQQIGYSLDHDVIGNPGRFHDWKIALGRRLAYTNSLTHPEVKPLAELSENLVLNIISVDPLTNEPVASEANLDFKPLSILDIAMLRKWVVLTISDLIKLEAKKDFVAQVQEQYKLWVDGQITELGFRNQFDRLVATVDVGDLRTDDQEQFLRCAQAIADIMNKAGEQEDKAAVVLETLFLNVEANELLLKVIGNCFPTLTPSKLSTPALYALMTFLINVLAESIKPGDNYHKLIC